MLCDSSEPADQKGERSMRTFSMMVIAGGVALSASAQIVQSYNRGDTVRIQARDEMKPSPNPRIVALAGDRIRIDTSGVFVNEMPVTWVSRDFIAIYGERPVDRVVAEGHYVVIADHRQNEDVSQFLGFISAGAIVGRVENSGFDVTRSLALP
jgi:signal peptidase I